MARFEEEDFEGSANELGQRIQTLLSFGSYSVEVFETETVELLRLRAWYEPHCAD